MMHKERSIYYKALIYLLYFIVANKAYAKISNSPHDVRAWFNYSSDIVKNGICSFCHIPHCGCGERLFPEGNDTTNTYGKIAGICWKCHGNNLYLGREEPVVYNEIFKTLDRNYSSVSGDMYSHPVRGTGSESEPDISQNVYIPAKLEWPWTEGWDSGKIKKDIECTTCHNVHDWNSSWDTAGGKRKFLRAPIYYESGGVGYNFCTNCHFNRESDTTKNNIEHSAGLNAKFSNCTTGAIMKNTSGMIRPLLDSTSLDEAGVDRGGRAIWDSETATGIFLGSRLYKNDIIICQTCHMPHGAKK